ncbi:MOS1T transposase, partial [Acromyrmex heyeri]
MELSLIEEQRINIKFLAKLGKNGREIFECLKQVYGDNSLKEPTVNKWLKRFREGREDVKDDQRSGRPSTSTSEENVERIRGCVLNDLRPDLVGRWILHHDNAPAHTSLVVREFLARSSIIVTEHPPYSPDLAPCDFFLFPKCKMVLRGRHLGDVEAIKTETTRQLKSLTTEDFQRSYQQWKRRWQKCILSQGEYFEGDHIEIPE